MAQLPPDSHAATASQFTSAFAVAVDNAIGAAMSPPAIAAVDNHLAEVLQLSSFRQARAKARPQMRTWCPFGRGASLDRAISVRHDGGRQIRLAGQRCPGGRTNATGLSMPPSGSPTTHAGLGFKLFASVKKTNGRYKSPGSDVTSRHAYIEQITSESREVVSAYSQVDTASLRFSQKRSQRPSSDPNHLNFVSWRTKNARQALVRKQTGPQHDVSQPKHYQ